MSWPQFDFTAVPPYQQIFDYTGSPDGVQPVYAGMASPGVPTSAAKWKIWKFVYVQVGTNFVLQRVQYANGDVGFKNIWNASAGVTYTKADTFK